VKGQEETPNRCDEVHEGHRQKNSREMNKEARGPEEEWEEGPRKRGKQLPKDEKLGRQLGWDS
jgi:hypothetical protein